MHKTLVDNETVEAVEDWILGQLAERFPNRVVEVGFDRQEDKWLQLAVSVPTPGGLFDRMPLLRELEETWEQEHPESEWRLLLIPAGRTSNGT